MIHSTTTSSPKRFYYVLPVGDWSCDGHNQFTDYNVNAAKDSAAILAAYEVAKETLPELDPLPYCKDFEDSYVDGAVALKVEELSDELGLYDTEFDEFSETATLNPDTWARYLVWYVNQGDPELDLVLAPPRQALSQALRGGYGLFWM